MKFSIAWLFIGLTFAHLGTAYAADAKGAIEALKAKLHKYGDAKVNGSDKAGAETVPALFFGTRKVNNNYDVVDDIKKNFGGTASIFVKNGAEFVRVTTNVLKDDGTRALGTNLAHNKAFDAISKGESFCGEVEILGSPYDTCYEPIKSGSDTVGIYYVGFKK